MSNESDPNEQVYNRIKAILSEHFSNYMFIVMDEDGSVFYDYTNVPIGKMLIREAQSEMEYIEADWEVDWAEDEDDD
tara:strand:- start:629 stop:859 length:231 start_codon:yes stop_codon:yes gene_type:complete